MRRPHDSWERAITRAARKLPYSSLKKAAVTKRLAKQAGIPTDEKTTPKASGAAKSSDTMQKPGILLYVQLLFIPCQL